MRLYDIRDFIIKTAVSQPGCFHRGRTCEHPVFKLLRSDKMVSHFISNILHKTTVVMSCQTELSSQAFYWALFILIPKSLENRLNPAKQTGKIM